MERCLTDDLPGIGGRIKERPEDFLVEEQPLYEPCGEGEHLYLFVEKTGMTTDDLVRHVARKCRVGRRDVGYAGLKDKHAITRQHLSVYLPGGDAQGDAEAVAEIERSRRTRVLWASRHANKLRRGHHGGNRFVIRVRAVEATAVLRARPILDRLAERGVPNRVGPQRFGFRNNSQEVGRLLLLGEFAAMLDEMLGRTIDGEGDLLTEARAFYRSGAYREALDRWPKSLRYDRQVLDALVKGRSPGQAVRAISREQLDLLVNAFQSQVFNEVLARRLDDDSFDRLLPGDLAFKHENRACFAVDQATAELENGPDGRVGRFEVSPSGPMWAADMTRARGAVDEVEVAVLAAHGMSPQRLGGDGKSVVRAVGSRRPLRVRLRDPEVSGGVDEFGGYVRLAFELPRGSYATTVLEEVMKGPVVDGPGA